MPPRLLLRSAHLLEGPAPGSWDQTVVVEGERIAYAGDAAGAPATLPGDRVVDLGGRSLLPGLFSCHFHASFEGARLELFPLGIDEPPGLLMLRAAKNARLALEAGFTSVIGAGGGDDLDAQLALAIERGLVPGPRVMPCSRNLGTTGGYVDLAKWWWQLGNTGACRIVDGPDEMRRAVREEIRRGARMIKLFATGGHGNENSGTRELSDAELAAAVEAAHARGARVRAHCAWKPEILRCIAAGVDVIDHGDELDDECIEALRERGAFLDPSALYLERLLACDELRAAAPAAVIRAAEAELENLAAMLPRAHAAGVRIVLGDDYGTDFLPHGSYAQELVFYVKRLGFAPLDVLRWATVHGAELAGRADELGRIRAGHLADLLVVDGDPSADIALLEDPARIQLILKGGAVAKDTLGGASELRKTG